jgi:hypothetical protein
MLKSNEKIVAYVLFAMLMMPVAYFTYEGIRRIYLTSQGISYSRRKSYLNRRMRY